MSTERADLSPLLDLLHHSAPGVAATSAGSSGSSRSSRSSGGSPPEIGTGDDPSGGSSGHASTATASRTEQPPEPGRPSGPPVRRSMAFQPGLEGLRGLAVAGVLVFHGGFEWATGGFLGVSTFFTLSGFLITTLLILEHRSTGTISLRKFWGRRFRRLMPASLVVLGGVVVLFAPFVASPSQLDSLPGDVISALAYVANWHFVISGQSYESLFAAPSPLLHFWSLAIEEQFYVVFPLLISVLVVRIAFRRTALLWILGGLAVASTLEMAWLYSPGDTSRVYYGTDTRAAELLLGAVLAVVLIDRDLLPRTVRRIALALGSAALVAVLFLWHGTAQTDSWLYRGGFAVYALLSCAVIVAATQPGVVKVVLSTPVLRWLGRVSYGAYLIHWPIFLWLGEALPGWNAYALFALKLAVTFTLAETSLRLVESPIREKKRLTRWQPLVAAPLAIAVIVGATFFVTSQPRDLSQQVTLDNDHFSLSAQDAPTTTTTLLREVTPIPPAPEQVPLLPFAQGNDLHVLFEGDSALFTLVGEAPHGLIGWAQANDAMQVANKGDFGCGLARGGLQLYSQKVEQAGVLCPDWVEQYAQELDGTDNEDGVVAPGHVKPQVVVAMVGIWDVLDKQLSPDDEWRHMGDPLYDAFFARELATAMDILASRGAVVIWLTHPPVKSGIREGLDPDDQPESAPARMDRLNELVNEVAATRPHARVIDLAGYMAARPQGAMDLTERVDGIHWNDRDNGVLAEWLGPQILQTYEQAWHEITAAEAAAVPPTSVRPGG